MGETVSNHDLLIATRGTGHIARAAPASDVCWVNAEKTMSLGFANNQPSAHLKTKASAKTLIANEIIWVSDSLLDAAESNPAHAGKFGGVRSTTYIKWAKAKSWSKDVKVEGRGVVRSWDDCHNNGTGDPFNTTGKVDASNCKAVVDPAAEAAKQRCVIVSVSGQCDHKRDLNAKDLLLDVVGGDKVTLSVKRIDNTTGGPSPCKVHPYWVAVREKDLSARVEKVADEFVAEGPITQDVSTKVLGLKGSEGSAGIKNVGPRDNSSLTRFNAPAPASLGEAVRGNGSTAGSGRGLAADIANRSGILSGEAPRQPSTPREHRNQQVQERAEKAAQQFNTLNQLLQLLRLLVDPPVGTISVQACAGAKLVKVRVFPSDSFQFDLFSDTIKAAFEKFRDIERTISFIADTFSIKRTTKFLENPNLKAIVQFKELEADKNGYYKWQCRPTFELQVGFDALVHITYKETIALLTFIGPIGRTAAWLLEKVGAEGNVFAEVDFKIDLSFKGGFDQYWLGNYTGGNCKGVLIFKLGLEFFAGRGRVSVEAQVYAFAECTLEFAEFKATKTHWIDFKLKGGVQLGCAGSATGRFLGFKTEGEFEWKPEAGKFPKGNAELPVSLVKRS